MRTLVIDAENLGENHKYWIDHHRLRRKIFVERLGWDLRCAGDLEYDSFDTPAAHYVVAIDDDDQVCAVSRLLPTTAPYMIQQLWPDWPEAGCPRSDAIWEASRFGCAAGLSSQSRQEAIRMLFREIHAFGQQRGIEYYLMVMPRFIFERLIRPNGYRVDYVGADREIDGVRTCLGKVTIRRTAQSPAGSTPASSPARAMPMAKDQGGRSF
jgi:acyl homoserine lactone synthase